MTWNDLTAKYLNSNFSKFLGRFSELKCGVTMWLLYSILQMTFLCVLCVIYRTNQWSTDCTVFVGLGVMVFTATFNNISVIPWWSVLLVAETGVPEKNSRPAASH